MELQFHPDWLVIKKKFVTMHGHINIKSTSSICVTPHMDDMNANLQAANRLANEIFDKQRKL